MTSLSEVLGAPAAADLSPSEVFDLGKDSHQRRTAGPCFQPFPKHMYDRRRDWHRDGEDQPSPQPGGDEHPHIYLLPFRRVWLTTRGSSWQTSTPTDPRRVGAQPGSCASSRLLRMTARGRSFFGEDDTRAFTQLAGTELSSRTDLRNKVAGMASSAPRVPST